MTGQEEKGQQTYAAQQRPQQHDLPAVKGNVAGNNTIEAEQQQCDEVTDKKTVLLIHEKASCARKSDAAEERKEDRRCATFWWLTKFYIHRIFE